MRKVTAVLPVALLAAALPGVASAYKVTTVDQLSQSEFRLLSEDLGAALSYKPLIPSEASGISGFDVGVSVAGSQLKNAVLLSKASNAATVHTTMPLIALRATKGLPANIDVGLDYTIVPGSNLRAIGGEFRWAILPGSTAVPAVALRFSGSKVSGADQLDLSTYGIDASISKGLAIFTPYAGVGNVWVRSSANNIPALKAEKFTQFKGFVGVNINVGFNLAFELDNTGGITTLSAKGGIRF